MNALYLNEFYDKAVATVFYKIGIQWSAVSWLADTGECPFGAAGDNTGI